MAVLTWALLGSAICGAGGLRTRNPVIPEPHEHMEYNAIQSISDPDTYDAYVYTPPSSKEGKKFPLIVYLHAASQMGGDLSKTLDPTAVGTPLYEVWSKRAPVELGRHFIVAGPHSVGEWDSGKVLKFLDFLLSPQSELPIDATRISIMGWAEGGDMALQLAGMTPRRFAAVAVAAAHAPPQAHPYKGMPLWAFHAENDVVVNYTGIFNFVKELDRHEGGDPDETHLTVYDEAPEPYGLPDQTGHASCMAAFLTPYLYFWTRGHVVPEQN